MNDVSYKKKRPEEISDLGRVPNDNGNVIKGYQEANKEVLVMESLSAQERFLYVTLLTFREKNSNHKLHGKAYVTNELLEAVPGMNEKFISRYKPKLIKNENGVVQIEKHPITGGTIYSFPYQKPGVSEWDEKITNAFIYSNDLNREEKQFIICLLPHILSEGNYFEYSNSKLAEKMGGAYNRDTIRKYLNRFEEKGIFSDDEGGKRWFKIDVVMSGTIQYLIEENRALRKELSKMKTKLGIGETGDRERALVKNGNFLLFEDESSQKSKTLSINDAGDIVIEEEREIDDSEELSKEMVSSYDPDYFEQFKGEYYEGE